MTLSACFKIRINKRSNEKGLKEQKKTWLKLETKSYYTLEYKLISIEYKINCYR